MDKKTANELAYQISTNNWDKNPRINVLGFSVKQFEGTAFDSDYKTYKISGYDWKPIGPDLMGKREYIELVAKITNPSEPKILRELSRKRLKVPSVLNTFTNNSDKVMLFEKFIQGKELYLNSTLDNWIKTAESLANIHSMYWNDTPHISSAYWDNLSSIEKDYPVNLLKNKLCRAESTSLCNGIWNVTFKAIKKRLDECPHTLIHGDAFPTNIIVNHQDIYFIDWANAGNFPYMLDIGRITGLYNLETYETFCPDTIKFCKAYYNIIRNNHDIPFKIFMRDVYMAQFIELLKMYNTYIDQQDLQFEYNQKLRSRLNELCILINDAV